MPSILFVCTANLYRSPLAAALFARALRQNGQAGHWVAESAGTWAIPGQSVPPALSAAAEAANIDLTRHVSRRVSRALLARYDLVLVMEKGQGEALRFEFPSAQQKIHLLSVLADHLEYDIADPVASGMQVEQLIEEMSGLIARAYPHICRLAQLPGTGLPPTSRHANYTF